MLHWVSVAQGRSRRNTGKANGNSQRARVSRLACTIIHDAHSATVRELTGTGSWNVAGEETRDVSAVMDTNHSPAVSLASVAVVTLLNSSSYSGRKPPSGCTDSLSFQSLNVSARSVLDCRVYSIRIAAWPGSDSCRFSSLHGAEITSRGRGLTSFWDQGPVRKTLYMRILR